MPDFNKLLSRPAGVAKPPKVLVPGNYPAVIKGHEIVQAPPGKDYDMIIRFPVGLTGWPDTATDEDKTQETGEGTGKPLDLSKRQLRRDFYANSEDVNSTKRLDDFIRSCGIEPAGRSYQEVLPELTGAHVIAEVQQYLNQRTNELGNQIGGLTGAK